MGNLIIGVFVNKPLINLTILRSSTILGSVSDYCAHNCTVPIIIVKAQPSSKHGADPSANDCAL